MASDTAAIYRVNGLPPGLATKMRTAEAHFAETPPGSRLAKLISDHPVTPRRRKDGEYLFRAGDTFQSFHVISAGFAKTCNMTMDGREQTTGLHMRGDILGLDGISTGTHGYDAIAIDTCDVLAIPIGAVLAGSLRNPDLIRELYHAFSAEIRSDQNLMLHMRSTGAGGRVAAFLLEMSMRFASRGFSANELQLPLSRREIGSMIGLELETVSRVFSRFAGLGLITVCLRKIVLLNRDGLRMIVAEPEGQKKPGRQRPQGLNGSVVVYGK